ncbi:hypothetical protein HKX48_000770 [Thoreauomyces humboldtii]|nr:hypothetical protein HKX48_000770 [Thoreauomyces humboldtii]
MLVTSLFACATLALSVVAAPTAAGPRIDNTTVVSTSPIFNFTNFDFSVSPGVDFDSYVNGGWKKQHPLSSSQTSYGAFTESAEYVQEALKELFDHAATNKSDVSLFAKVVKSGMNTKATEKAGISPIADLIAKIDAAKTTEDLVIVRQVTAALHREALGISFSTGVGKDPKTPINVVQLGDLGGSTILPQDYYGNASDPLNAQYRTFIGTMLRLADPKLSVKQAATEAANVWTLEAALNSASLTLDQRDDISLTYNQVSISNLTTLAPGFNWPCYFRELGYKDLSVLGKFVIVNNPSYFTAFSKLIAQKTQLETFKAYYKFNLISSSAPFLSSKFATANFDFVSKTLNGAETPSPHWEDVFSFIENNIPDTVAQPYAAKKFSPEDKATVLGMIESIRTAFGQHIQDRDWLSAATKEKAQAKLKLVNFHIGYPDKWDQYADMKAVSDAKPFATNRRIILAAQNRRNLVTVGQKPNSGQWDMPPTQVNAYYSAEVNSLYIAMGLLSPPNYYPASYGGIELMGFNFGSMAAGTGGHELSHGFDDNGRMYDGYGSLDNWWTDADAANFQTHAQKLIDQFSSYKVLGLSISGSATLGENIADLGGLSVGFTAFQNWMSTNGRVPDFVVRDPVSGKVATTLTAEQQFFAGYAVSWREIRRDASLRKQIATDVHAPASLRIIGPMSDLPPFWKAFDVAEGQPERQSADKAVVIW